MVFIFFIFYFHFYFFETFVTEEASAIHTVGTEISVQIFIVQRLSVRPVSELIVAHTVRGSPHCRVTSEPQKLAAAQMPELKMH